MTFRYPEQRFATSASKLTIYRSPRRQVLLAALVGAAACLAIPFVTASYGSVQIAGVIWLGFCAHALCRQLERALDRRPIVRIDARGILDTRILPRPIEWSEIAAFYPINVSRSRVVELELHDPHRTLAEAPRSMRIGLDWDMPHVCISLLLLDGSVTDVIEAIRRHAPYLVPRTEGAPQRRPGAQVRAPARSNSRWIG
jgi:hypothetical protein